MSAILTIPAVFSVSPVKALCATGVLDAVSGEAFGTETIGYGRRVSVIALPAPPVFLTRKGLEHVGPRAFGYDLDFRSVFDTPERAIIASGRRGDEAIPSPTESGSHEIASLRSQ